MALPTASDNVFPKLIVSEGAAPATPSSGQVKLYAKTDGLLYSKDDAGTETLVSGGAGGGGGTDVVQVASGAGSIIIPGLSGSPDIRVAGTNDDEFDTTDTSDPMTGWTSFGSPTHDINSTVKSHYSLKAPGSDNNLHGIYKACPSIPFTMTAKLSDAVVVADYNYVGIAIAEGTPGKYDLLGIAHSGTSFSAQPQIGIELEQWTNRTTFSAQVTNRAGAVDVPCYLRIVVTLSTNVAYYYSRGGMVWRALTTGRNPGFTVGAVALFASSQNATQAHGIFDWVRFT